MAAVDDERFRAFVEGRSEPAEAIAARLRGLDLPADAMHCRYGLLRKVLVRLANGAGYVKLALHPLSAALLRNEAQAYAEPCPPDYGRPRFRLLADDGDWAAAWLSVETGRQFSRWTALTPRRGPFETGGMADTTVADHLAALSGTPRLDAWQQGLTRRHGCEPLKLARSHGDFINWNLLHRSDGRAIVLDFEYYAPARSLAFDRCHWTMAPILRRGSGIHAAKWGAALLATCLGVSRRDLAIAVAEHAARLEKEHAMADFVALTGAAAMMRRTALLNAYDVLMAQLVR
jgi:hypothetical protein